MQDAGNPAKAYLGLFARALKLALVGR